ncbi:MAG: hypothetical protein IJQ62_13515 [Clostridia bacterium]|nr:hypothetical protein [Clostridia bacterium]
MCGSPNVAFKYTATAGDWYDCGDCGWFFYIESSSGAGSDYISVPFSGEGEGEIKFVSTRRCVVTLNGVKEYFSFRVEDGKLILTNAEGVETEVTVGEDGKGALEITLGNGETFTASFPATTLSGIVNNGVFPIQKNLDN